MSQHSSGGKRQSARQLRERKQKKLYSEDWALGDDDEIEGRRSFNLQEKLENPLFATHNIVKEMHGSELNVAYLQKYGFNTPLLFKEKTGLGLRVPTSNFTINDVRMCVGSRRILDVMDVNTQKNSEMTMKEWQKYYEDPDKDKLLNVISLEFSHTKLENYVQSPTVVRQVDWVDCVWPRHLKESQIEATNVLEDMKYPKVQKYCLMSVKGCYTDFHVDFGGTSVWYHILKGCKVFWLIPPTDHNLALYERWVLSGKQSDVFFGDTVERCARITLQQGNTFFIPTGWIHAVYTPVDSLVFGGNFLHSYGIDKQLKIANVEDTTKVPQKFRYPFFTEMLWYVLERYVHCLLGHSHLTTGHDVILPPDKPHVHLTQAELHGLKEIVMFLHMLPPNKKNVPDLIRDPVSLIQDVRTLIGQHRQDNRDLAITGRPVLHLPPPSPEEQDGGGKSKMAAAHMKYDRKQGVRAPAPSGGCAGTPKSGCGTIFNNGSGSAANNNNNHHSNGNNGGNNNNNNGSSNGSKMARAGSGEKGEKGAGGGPRRRRTRCKKCEACQRSDCGECSFCLDMVKFGGPGRAKQTCNMRQCLQPMLPVTAACAHCGLDGWMQTPVAPLQKGPQRCESASNLMECSVCYEIAHPACVQHLCPEYTGYMNEDMPNSWECPMCCKLGKNTDYRPRHFRARQKSTDMRRMSISSSEASSAFENNNTAGAMATGGGGGNSKTYYSQNFDQYNSDSGGGGEGGGLEGGSGEHDHMGGPMRGEHHHHGVIDMMGGCDYNTSGVLLTEGTSMISGGMSSPVGPLNSVITGPFSSAIMNSSMSPSNQPLTPVPSGGPGFGTGAHGMMNKDSNASSFITLTPFSSNNSNMNSSLLTAQNSLNNSDFNVMNTGASASSNLILNNNISNSGSSGKDLLPIKKRRSSDNGSDQQPGEIVTLATNPLSRPHQTVDLSSSSTSSSINHNNTTNNSTFITNTSTTTTCSSTTSTTTSLSSSSSSIPRKTAFRAQLAQQMASNSTKLLKKPMVVVRPAPLNNNSSSKDQNSGGGSNLAMDRRCMLQVFKYMNAKELVTCALVCKTWAAFSVDPSLWRLMEFKKRHISSDILKGIVRRQPERLRLDWCHINKFQLPWLFQRLSVLKELSLIAVNVKTAVSLKSNHSAMLQHLDLSFVSDFSDSCLRDILGPCNDSRRGLADEKIRFRNLKTLKLAGTDVTDIALRYITQYLPNLAHLNLSLCPRISDAGIAQLTTKPAHTLKTLLSLDLSHSKLVTETSLDHLAKCENLVRLDCRHALQISTQALIKFAAKSDRNLQVRDIKLVDKRQSKVQ